MMRFLFPATLFVSLLVVCAPTAHALKFANQFVEFELPNNWKCGLEGAEWICQSTDETRKKDAIIILAAKLKGDQDTLEKYEAYLKKPRAFAGPGGKSISSDAKYTANKTINGHLWVDALHLQSEIPDFFTRYLATVEKDIGVLVTYSVTKAKFQDYQKQFEDMVGSIRVFRKGALNAAAPTVPGTLPGGPTVPGFTPGFTPGTTGTGIVEKPKAPKSSGDGGGAMGLILLLAAAGGGFIFWKKKQQGG